jgi:hypothetical protein
MQVKLLMATVQVRLDVERMADMLRQAGLPFANMGKVCIFDFRQVLLPMVVLRGRILYQLICFVFSRKNQVGQSDFAMQILDMPPVGEPGRVNGNKAPVDNPQKFLFGSRDAQEAIKSVLLRFLHTDGINEFAWQVLSSPLCGGLLIFSRLYEGKPCLGPNVSTSTSVNVIRVKTMTKNCDQGTIIQSSGKWACTDLANPIHGIWSQG